MRAGRRLLVSFDAIGIVAVMTAAVAFATTVSWGKAVAAGGEVLSISCASAGNCAAGGDNGSGAFVQNETGGVWGAAITVPGTNGGQMNSVSCKAAGFCVAGGYDNNGAFVADEKAGVWAAASYVPGATGVNSVSCSSAGNCAAGGAINGGLLQEAFVVSEKKNGVWGKPINMKAFKLVDANVTSISCWSAGNCVAGGSYNSTSFPHRAFLVSEKSGVWGKAVKVRGRRHLDLLRQRKELRGRRAGIRRERDARDLAHTGHHAARRSRSLGLVWGPGRLRGWWKLQHRKGRLLRVPD